MSALEDRSNEIIQQVWGDAMRTLQEAELRDILANPEAHKLTRLMGPKGASYRYYPAGKDGRGWEVRFCYSCWRNAAGYFLGWREVIPQSGSKAKHSMKRDKWVARKVRRRAAELADRRAKAFKEKRKTE